LVLVVDRAEHASEEFLDHLDIMLSIRSESDEPAVQSVLLACLTGTGQGKPAPIVWWLDRIQTLDLEFAPIPREGVASYIHKHLKRAGWRGERLFSSEAALVIAGVTGGVPGEISRFCERLLAEAAEHGHPVIDAEFVQESIDASNGGDDSEGAHESPDAEHDAIRSVDHIDHAHGIDAAVGAETGKELELANPVADMASGDTRPDGVGPDEVEPSANHSSNSLAQTLERFERAEADVSAVSPDSCDEQEPEGDDEDADECLRDSSEDDSLAALEEYLGAPVSPEELRAIRRGGLHQQLRAIAAILLAALVGAVAFAWMDADPEQTTARESRKPDRPPLSMLESTKPAAFDAPTRTLARVRGQVASIGTPAGASFTTERLPITGPDSAWEEDEAGELSPDDFEDMRPASMRVDAATDFDAEAQF
jgi:hypothetical protein